MILETGLVLASVLLSGSASGQTIRSVYDEFEKTKTCLLELEVFGTEGSNEAVDMTVAEVTDRNGETTLFIKTSYRG